jgi:hypothetical protein
MKRIEKLNTDERVLLRKAMDSWDDPTKVILIYWGVFEDDHVPCMEYSVTWLPTNEKVHFIKYWICEALVNKMEADPMVEKKVVLLWLKEALLGEDINDQIDTLGPSFSASHPVIRTLAESRKTNPSSVNECFVQ